MLKKVLFIILFISSFIFTSCEYFNNSAADYFEYWLGTVQVGAHEIKTPYKVINGQENISIEKDGQIEIYLYVINPKNYELLAREGVIPFALYDDKNNQIPNFIIDLEKHPDLIIIAAHFGGYTEWDKAVEYLVGKNVYFDTSSTLWKLPVPEADKIIKAHGVEKFLFGSDYPMWDHEGELARFNKLNFSAEERELVMHKNAEKLLGL